MSETCNATNESCLVAKLSHYIDLTPSESRLLETLQENERDFRRRDAVFRLDAEMPDIFVVKSGWIYSHADNLDGSEYIAMLYFPGDVVGISQVGFARSPLTYSAATEVTICPFPKLSLQVVFREHPRLVALFFALATLEHAGMIDRLRAIGCMSARDRLAVLLLQIRARLRITGGRDQPFLDLPLSQELIGNAIGLSMVSVNRAFRQLEDEGRIRREGRRVEIVAPESLAAEVDFSDRHYAIDKSWFPAAAHDGP